MLPIIVGALAFFLSGFVQGIAGFGFAIVGMAILPHLMPFKEAFSLVAISAILIPFLSLLQSRQGAKSGPHIPLTIACVLGVLLGFWIMDQHSTGEIFLRCFGAALILFAVTDTLLSRIRDNFRMPDWMSWPCGFLGGFAGGAFNIPGPPLVAFAWSQKDWTHARIVAVLQFTFIAAMGLRLVLMGNGGYFSHPGLISKAAWSLLPSTLGILAGGKLAHKIPVATLKIWVFTGVAILGAMYLFGDQ